MVCSVVTPAALCSALIFSQPERLSCSICFVSDNKQQQHLSMIVSNTMANNLLGLLQCSHDIMADQHWEQPTDLTRAKNLFGRLRSSFTRRARNSFFHPQSKMQNVLLFAHTVWSKMEQEMLDNLITCGRANVTHFCLRHDPA